MLGCVLLRLLATHRGLWIISGVIFISLLAIWILEWQNNWQQKGFSTKTELRQQHLLVQPDEYFIDGDLLKLTGKWLERNEEVQFFYSLKSQAEQRRFAKIETAKIFLFAGTVQRVAGPTNENQFDYRRFLQGKNISNTIMLSQLSSEKEVSLQDQGVFFLAWLHGIRKKLLNQLETLPQPLAGYSQLLLLGFYDQSFETQLKQISSLGLLYLFSLSGMHIFYLAAFFRWLCTQLAITRETCDTLLLLLLPLYAVLGGFSASLVRAVMMVWIILSARKFLGISVSGITAEGLVLILNLLLCPALVFSLGAQLSYLLTLILLLNRQQSQLLVGLKMTAYSLPLILWQTFQWNLLTVLLSIAIVPLFERIVIPAVVLGVFFSWLVPIAVPILQFFCDSFAFLAQLPTTITFGKPPLLFIVFWLIIQFLLEYSKHARWLLGILICSYVIAAALIRLPFTAEVVYFDIGQGDCTLIREPFNQSVTLVDTGGKVNFQHEQWRERRVKTTGETIVANYLLSKGISHVDNLFLTHQDTDHVGNFASLSKVIDVHRILVPQGMEQLASFRKRLRVSNNTLQQVQGISTKVTSRIGMFHLLHPFASGTGKNEDSIALSFSLQRIKFIISGDLDKQGEVEVAQRNPKLRADVLKTGHHGSKTATASAYVSQLQPQLAIISAGVNNRYGHPNAATLATLAKQHIPFLNTANAGMIKLMPQEKGFIIQTFNENRKVK